MVIILARRPRSGHYQRLRAGFLRLVHFPRTLPNSQSKLIKRFDFWPNVAAKTKTQKIDFEWFFNNICLTEFYKLKLVRLRIYVDFKTSCLIRLEVWFGLRHCRDRRVSLNGYKIDFVGNSISRSSAWLCIIILN